MNNTATLYSIEGSSLLLINPDYFFVKSKYIIQLPEGFKQDGKHLIAPDGSIAIPIKTMLGIILLYPIGSKQGKYAVADVQEQYVAIADE